jgi:hypothetical protein
MTKLTRSDDDGDPYSFSFSFSLSLLSSTNRRGPAARADSSEGGREAKPCTGGGPDVLGNPLPAGQAFAVVYESSLGQVFQGKVFQSLWRCQEQMSLFGGGRTAGMDPEQ